MRVLILDVSVYMVYITNQCKTNYTQVGGGGVKSVSRGDRRKTLKFFVPITSKNSASVLTQKFWIDKHLPDLYYCTFDYVCTLQQTSSVWTATKKFCYDYYCKSAVLCSLRHIQSSDALETKKITAFIALYQSLILHPKLLWTFCILKSTLLTRQRPDWKTVCF